VSGNILVVKMVTKVAVGYSFKLKKNICPGRTKDTDDMGTRIIKLLFLSA